MKSITLRISDTRPIEELTGSNRGIVRMKLGNIHCMTPLSQCLRKCRPKNIGQEFEFDELKPTVKAVRVEFLEA